jgi:hypothetical protein
MEGKKLKTSKFAIASIVIFAQAFSLFASASIQRSPYGMRQFFLTQVPASESSSELQVNRVELPTTTQADVAKWIPLDMTDTKSEGHVFGRILGRGLSNALKDTSVGQAAQRVEKSLAKDISIGGADEDSVKHVFKFRVEAEKAEAKLNYQGLMNAQLSYEVAMSQLKFEIRQSIARDTDLFLSHIDKSDDHREILGVHLNF